MSPTSRPARFNLTRWFALAALVSITVLAVTLGTLLNGFITQRLLLQQAVLTKEFVQSLVQVEKSLQTYFEDPSRGLDAKTELAFKHIAACPTCCARTCTTPAGASSGRATGRSSAAASART